MKERREALLAYVAEAAREAGLSRSRAYAILGAQKAR